MSSYVRDCIRHNSANIINICAGRPISDVVACHRRCLQETRDIVFLSVAICRIFHIDNLTEPNDNTRDSENARVLFVWHLNNVLLQYVVSFISLHSLHIYFKLHNYHTISMSNVYSALNINQHHYIGVIILQTAVKDRERVRHRRKMIPGRLHQGMTLTKSEIWPRDLVHVARQDVLFPTTTYKLQIAGRKLPWKVESDGEIHERWNRLHQGVTLAKPRPRGCGQDARHEKCSFPNYCLKYDIKTTLSHLPTRSKAWSAQLEDAPAMFSSTAPQALFNN